MQCELVKCGNEMRDRNARVCIYILLIYIFVLLYFLVLFLLFRFHINATYFTTQSKTTMPTRGEMKFEEQSKKSFCFFPFPNTFTHYITLCIKQKKFSTFFCVCLNDSSNDIYMNVRIFTDILLLLCSLNGCE